MKEDAFRSWLLNSRGYGTGTVSSRVSNCKTVESYEGDLDQLFDQDKLRGLIDKLTYSKSDEQQNRPARHQIPINGNVYSGTATLRSAVSLYKQFREGWVEGSPIVPISANRERMAGKVRSTKSVEGRAWPIWVQPSSDHVLALAHVTMPFVRFLSPEIVRAVVEDNEKHRADWIEALKARRIDPTGVPVGAISLRLSRRTALCRVVRLQPIGDMRSLIRIRALVLWRWMITTIRNRSGRLCFGERDSRSLDQ